jgi:hypothetical protein
MRRQSDLVPPELHHHHRHHRRQGISLHHAN